MYCTQPLRLGFNMPAASADLSNVSVLLPLTIALQSYDGRTRKCMY